MHNASSIGVNGWKVVQAADRLVKVLRMNPPVKALFVNASADPMDERSVTAITVLLRIPISKTILRDLTRAEREQALRLVLTTLTLGNT